MNEKLSVLRDGEQKWYEKGLNFKCTECGKCCTGCPGYIWVNHDEILTIANHLKLPLEEFSKRYLRKIYIDGEPRFSLQEHPKTYACAFLSNNKCTIYENRPVQCRTYPWWPKNLRSKQDWENAAKWCEGISLDAPTVPIEKIEEQLAIQMKEAPHPNL